MSPTVVGGLTLKEIGVAQTEGPEKSHLYCYYDSTF